MFKNSTDIQGQLRLNLHSLSVSELLEYRCKATNINSLWRTTKHNGQSKIQKAINVVLLNF